MTVTYDVAILGAGIVGAACARALALGGLRVIVIDRAPVGSGATAAGMGHVVVMDDSEAQFALTRHSQLLWDQLAPQLPENVEYVPTGTLWVAADEEEMAAVHRKHIYYQSRGVATEVLDAPALAEAEPNLRSGLVGALRVSGDSVIYPPCAAAWLLEQARQRGACVRFDADVVSLLDTSIHLSDATNIACAAVVHATGAWAHQLAPGLPIRPRKGHLVITDRYPGFVRHQIVELGYLKARMAPRESVAFNLQPRKTGQMLLGSSRQFDVATAEVEPHMLERMIARGLEFIPALTRLSAIRAWTGFRAATPDSLPLIGPLPGRGGHYLATGHEGLGITTSLATAALIACHLLGHTSALSMTPYLPERFEGAAAHA